MFPFLPREDGMTMRYRSSGVRVVVVAVGVLVLAIAAGVHAQQPYRGQGTTGICPAVSSMTPITVTGRVESVTFPMAIVKTSSGEHYTLRLGPWWYWKQKGYELTKGETVTVEGFASATFITPRLITGSRGEIRLRDENGYPLWGGGGRGRWQ